MRKTILLFLIMLLYFIVCNFCMAQEKNEQFRELKPVYLRMKPRRHEVELEFVCQVRALHIFQPGLSIQDRHYILGTQLFLR